MNKKEVIELALKGQEVPYTPWSFKFTKEARELLAKHYGTDDIESAVNNHIVRLGNDIGFFKEIQDDHFQDVFGVVWDRTVDKDIGIVKGQVLPEPTLNNYKFPNPLDPRFFDNIETNLLPALQETIALSEHADFCVGYFNLRGWKQLDSYIDSWSGGEGHCCRLLVGMHRLPQDELRQAMRISKGDSAIDNQTALRDRL